MPDLNKNRYFAKEFHPGKWRICDRLDGNRPIYDENGENPLVFNEDRAFEYLEKLNENLKQIS